CSSMSRKNAVKWRMDYIGSPNGSSGLLNGSAFEPIGPSAVGARIELLGMNRRLVWLQLIIGWLPLWGLFAVLIATAHHATFIGAGHIAFRMIISAAALAFLVQKFAVRYPWPSRVTLGFVTTHVLAAAAFSITWILANSAIESVVQRRGVIVVGLGIAS